MKLNNLQNAISTAFAALFVTVAASTSAYALAITPATGVLNTSRWEGNENNTPAVLAAIAPIIGTATEQYKQDVGGGESGSLAGSYSTTFANTPADPSDATITYTGGTVLSPTRWLLVKDGNQSPAWYLFNLTALGWNGTEVLSLTGFWPNQGAISHVSLFGGTATQTTQPTQTTGNVPEPASILLIGAGLVVAARLRRRTV